MKNSIVKRWVLTFLVSTVLVILTVGIFSGVLLRKQYYDSVRMALNSRATSLVLSHFKSVSNPDDETFNRMAKNFSVFFTFFFYIHQKIKFCSYLF